MIKPRLPYTRLDSKDLFCPHPGCMGQAQDPALRRIVRHGFFSRSSDRHTVTRYRCRHCQRTFSRSTLHPCFMQKKRQINRELWALYCSEMNARRSAVQLRVNRKTVARRIPWLARQAHREQARILSKLSDQTRNPISSIQLDEMETFEHTKCKPISIPLVVDARRRFILAVEACEMPAHGPLAEIARRKYGPRPNGRIPTLRRTLSRITEHLDPRVVIRSDSHPYYPPVIREVLPNATHETVMSRRAAGTGQGELKKGKWDPIFSLNHTAAMLRANVCRLIRKTWCTTKRIDRLRDHLILYAVWHNLVILADIDAAQRAPRPSCPQAGGPV